LSTVLEKTIEIIFQGDDRTSEAINSLGSNMGKLQAGIEGTADKLAVVADGVLKLDAALLAMAVGGIAYAISKTGEFNAATNEIGTLITDTAFDMGKYRDSILDYAQSSTQSIESINSALYAAVSAGSSWENSITAMADAEKLAVAGKADLRDSTVLLLSTLNAYGEGVDQAAKYSDIFFTTVKLGQTTIPELAQSLANVTTIAAGANIPIETIAAAIADLTAKGMPTSEAITAIRGAIESIITPSTSAAAMAEKLGIEFNATALASKGFEGVLLDVYNATGGNIEETQKFFKSIEGLKAALGLFGKDGGDAFLAKLELMRESEGAVSEAYLKMVDNLEYQNQRLINTMQTTFIKVGAELIEGFSGDISSLSDLFKALNFSIDQKAFDEVFKVLNEFSSNLSVFIDGIAKALPEALSKVDFTGFADALRNLSASFGDFLGGLDLSKPEDLAEAIQKAVNVLTGLVNVTAGMVDQFKPFIQQIADFFIELSKGDEEAMKFAGSILAYAKMISEAGIYVVGALVAMQETGTNWSTVFTGVAGTVGAVWNALTVTIREAAKIFVDSTILIYEVADLLTGGLIPAFGNSIDYLKGVSAGLADSIAQDKIDFAGSVDAISGGFFGLKDSAIAAAGGVNQLSGEVDGIPDDKKLEIDVGGVEGARALVEAYGVDVDKVPEEKLTEIAAMTDSVEIDRAIKELGAIPDEKDVDVGAEADKPAIDATGKYLDGQIPDEKDVDVGAEPDQPTIDAAGKKLDVLSTPRTAPIEPKVDELALERLKGQMELMQTAVEWKAKLDIAEVEANAQIVEAAFGTLSNVFTSSAEIISSALGALGGDFGAFGDSTRNKIFDVINKELALRERAMNATEKLIDTQIEYMKSRMRAMEAGDGLIQIDGAGLQPHLEAFMWEILGAIQTRVNEEGHAMLFGI
jgi:TP901 family phage tail tape measure protein